MKLILHPEFGLFEKGGRAFCDSLMVAETFGKEHKSVLQTIEGENRKGVHVNGLIDNLMSLAGNPAVYFEKDKYKNSQNKSQPKYLMSRDGFTLLAMGFTGEKALRFKLDYINRFNQMESFILSLQATKMEFPAFTEAIMLSHDEPKHYHYSNEINMIYRIVLGVDAKTFKATRGLDKDLSLRPYLKANEIKAVETLQRIDIGLMEAGLGYEERKAQLSNSYARRLVVA